jgi:phosphonate transport system permease protein
MVGGRGWVLLSIAVAGIWAALRLDLDPRAILPNAGGMQVARDFFARAVSPALTYESATPVPGALPLLVKALGAAHRTLIFAGAAVSLALLIGLPLGFLCSTVWWDGDPTGGESRAMRILRRNVAPLIYGSCRALATVMRSIHELLWAVIFLAALGASNLTAVIAIAIPFSGTFAKVFSELLDETQRDSAAALRSAGASPVQAIVFGVLPRAQTDMTAYAFYRFECALRSSAILGFFGYPTLGYFIAASFENLYYGEVWTYLYTLLLLVAAADWWSGSFRRSFVR